MLNYILTNWKTTLIGVAFAVAFAVRDAYVTGTLHKSTIVVTILAAIWGAVMKDVNITGGSKLNAANDPQLKNIPKLP